jgi:hypothetical protein
MLYYYKLLSMIRKEGPPSRFATPLSRGPVRDDLARGKACSKRKRDDAAG